MKELTPEQSLTNDLLEALEAISARINGEFDNPALVKKGYLSTSTDEDVLSYAQDAIEQAKGMR